VKNKKRLSLILAVLLLLFSSSITAFAQNEKPSSPVAGEVKDAQGSQFETGWNYFSIENTDCTIKKILDELQADGGGALIADFLWTKEEDWIKHDLAEATQSVELIDPSKTIAFFSNMDFFFDLGLDVCSQDNPERDDQILGLRSVKNKDLAAKKSLIEKIATLPFEFWQGFWDLVSGKKEQKIEDVTVSSDTTVNLESLTVTGKANLAELGITGTVTAGLLTFDGLEGSINTLSGPLKLQGLALEGIELVQNKVIIDKNGNLKITSGVIFGNASFRGFSIVKSGETSARVEKEWPSSPAVVNITPTWNTNVWVTDISEGGFNINVNQAPGEDKEVFWFAIW